MIVCGIEIAGGKAVRPQFPEGDDALALARRLGRCGEVALVDRDAAAGRGNNRPLIEQIVRGIPCRVSGGIRDVATAKSYLEAGAQRVVFDPGSDLESLAALPRERLFTAAKFEDAASGRVLSIARLFAGVSLTGPAGTTQRILDRAVALKRATGGSVTVEGGIRSVDEIVRFDREGVDVRLDAGLSREDLDPVDAMIGLVDFGKGGGMVPTIVCDARGGRVRMLSYSTEESLRIALREGIGCYWSRSRGRLWRKGETSGNAQQLVRVGLDCDRDSLIFFVRQTGPACHTGKDRCFDHGQWSWEDLTDRIALRSASEDPASYTRRLLGSKTLLDAKLREEADETARAETGAEVAWECADLLFFMSVKMQRANIGIGDVMAHLASRAAGR